LGGELDYYKNEQEIEAVVTGFERCTIAKDEFSHLRHLAVAVYYLRDSTPEQAFQKMRDGLLRFLDHHGISRTHYKDALTHRWITLVQSVIEQMNPESSLVDVTNAVLERLGDSRLTDEGE
jgi:hypothetical protein